MPLVRKVVVLFCWLHVVQCFFHALPGLVISPSFENFMTSLTQPDIPQLLSSSLPDIVDDVATPLKIVDSTFKEAILPEGNDLFSVSHTFNPDSFMTSSFDLVSEL